MAIKCTQELNEVLGLVVELLELLVLSVEGLHVVTVRLMFLLQDSQNLFDLRQIELLEESVESGISLAPVFGLTLGGATFFLLGILTVDGLFDSDNPLIHCGDEVVD